MLSCTIGCGGRPLVPWVFFPVELKIAATITSTAAPKYTSILRFFCRTPLGSTARATEFRFRIDVGAKVVSSHRGYPFVEREKFMRFLPSSTYPLSMIFGMMYVPSRRS